MSGGSVFFDAFWMPPDTYSTNVRMTAELLPTLEQLFRNWNDLLKTFVKSGSLLLTQESHFVEALFYLQKIP